MRQRMEDMEQKHKEEIEGLSTEWTTERRVSVNLLIFSRGPELIC